MIKALSKAKDGRNVIILGLSRVNTEKLLEGMPIKVDLQEAAPRGLELPGGDVIVIVGGETEAAITAELAKFLELPS